MRRVRGQYSQKEWQYRKKQILRAHLPKEEADRLIEKKFPFSLSIDELRKHVQALVKNGFPVNERTIKWARAHPGMDIRPEEIEANRLKFKHNLFYLGSRAKPERVIPAIRRLEMQKKPITDQTVREQMKIDARLEAQRDEMDMADYYVRLEKLTIPEIELERGRRISKACKMKMYAEYGKKVLGGRYLRKPKKADTI